MPMYYSKIKINYDYLFIASTKSIKLGNVYLTLEVLEKHINKGQRFDVVTDENENITLEVEYIRKETKEEYVKRITKEENYNKRYEKFHSKKK